MEQYTLSHLRELEAESIHIIREVAAEFENPVMLYSIGKDSSVMVRLAEKAFYPGKVPFPLMHIDSKWKFKEMIEFRDSYARQHDWDLIVESNTEAFQAGVGPFTHGSKVHTDLMKTKALLQALDKYKFDAAFGGARRDEEKSRAKERIYSFRDKFHQWDPKNQRPELWDVYNARVHKGESIRVFPLSNWTELDIWQYIRLENIPIVPLYFAKERPIVNIDGNLIMADDDRLPEKYRKEIEMKTVRFRTLGCWPLTGAVESNADTIEKIVEEMMTTTKSERTTRVIDFDQEASMEQKKEKDTFNLRIFIMALDIKAYLDKDEQKDLLRLLTAGSVDDGKSTLIGRLLFDSKKLYEDQLDALERDSKRVGNAGEHIDYALLLDGLKAEREQGITIDVAYRYFSTNKRKFIIADTPGHEQYTRNMITGGSTANLAIILVDARTGIITQTKRHTYLTSLLGIKHIVLAVNKMDLVDFDQSIFDNIANSYREFIKPLGIEDVTCIPLSALDGDNVVNKSERTPWYNGLSLLDHLENVPIDRDRNYNDFRFPVQYVLRPNLDFRGFSGKVASGVIRKGDQVMALPSGKQSRVKSIVTYDQELEYAFPPQSITITLEDEIDVSRGEMLIHPENKPCEGRSFETMLVWMDEEPMDTSKQFFLKHTTNITRATIDRIKYKVNINTMEQQSIENGLMTKEDESFSLNQIGCVTITTARELFFDPYKQNRQTGAFILIDPITNNTSAVGMIIKANDQTEASLFELPELNLPKLGITPDQYPLVDRIEKELKRQGFDLSIIKE